MQKSVNINVLKRDKESGNITGYPEKNKAVQVFVVHLEQVLPLFLYRDEDGWYKLEQMLVEQQDNDNVEQKPLVQTVKTYVFDESKGELVYAWMDPIKLDKFNRGFPVG